MIKRIKTLTSFGLLVFLVFHVARLGAQTCVAPQTFQWELPDPLCRHQIPYTIPIIIDAPAVAPTVFSNSATFAGGLSVPDNSVTGLSNQLVLSGSNGQFITASSTITVDLSFTTARLSDMRAYLVKPGCGSLVLFANPSEKPDSLFDVTFVAGITMPFSTSFNDPNRDKGTYGAVGVLNQPQNIPPEYNLPTGPLQGCSIDGSWELWLFDNSSGQVIKLQSWQLRISDCQYIIIAQDQNSKQLAVKRSQNTQQAEIIVDVPYLDNLSIFINIANKAGFAAGSKNAQIRDSPMPVSMDIQPGCNSTTGSATWHTLPLATPNNPATLPAEYSLGGLSWSNNNVVNNLSAGSYTFLARNALQPQCVVAQVFQVASNVVSSPPNSVIRRCADSNGFASAVLTNTASGGQTDNNVFTQTKSYGTPLIPVDSNSVQTIAGCNFLRDSIFVAGLTGTISNESIVSVNLNINHVWFSDLDIWLVGPENCGTLTLSTDNGGTNDHFKNVTITSDQSYPNIRTIKPIFLTQQLETHATFASENTLTTAPQLFGSTNDGQFDSSNTDFLINYANSPCLFNPQDPAQLPPYGIVPKKGLAGCPANGWWKLVVVDDRTAISGSLYNWTLHVKQPGDFYQHQYNTTNPGVVLSQPTISGTKKQFAKTTASQLPVGVTTITHQATLDNCTSTPNQTIVKVFARPKLIDYTVTCLAEGAMIVVNATLDQGNFTLPADIGQIQWRLSNTGPWQTINTPIGPLPPGNHQLFLRNSASLQSSGQASCTTGPTTIIITTQQVTYYLDSDGDGYGSNSVSQTQCFQPFGYVSNSTDCNDTNPAINPGATEIYCDGIDNNCQPFDDTFCTPPTNLTATQITSTTALLQWQQQTCAQTYFVQFRQLGTTSWLPLANTTGNNHLATGLSIGTTYQWRVRTQCAQNQGSSFAAPKKFTTLPCTNVFYADADSDGFGNASVIITSCTQPLGYVTNSTDCYDNNPNINPQTTEVCDGLDNNCNGQVDENILSIPTFEPSQLSPSGMVYFPQPPIQTTEVQLRYRQANLPFTMAWLSNEVVQQGVFQLPASMCGPSVQVQMRIFRCNVFSTWKGLTSNVNCFVGTQPQTHASLYPNPTNGLVNIVFDNQPGTGTLTVIDMSARVLITKPIDTDTGRQTLDLSDLPAGTYRIAVTTNESTDMFHVVLSQQ
jgi:subtilisin-like proprotein convertase family protein